MKITKYGHSCLLIEEKDARILLDPGVYSKIPDLEGLSAILITHTHQDHLDFVQLKKIVAKNPRARIFGNEEVCAALEKEGLQGDRLGDKDQAVVSDVIIEGVGTNHALIHKTIPQIKNTGYLVANKLFYPGDALTIPDQPVEILALPVIAPWMKISETIDYFTSLKPKIAFPVHDGFLASGGPYYMMAEYKLKEAGIKWTVIESGKSQDF